MKRISLIFFFSLFLISCKQAFECSSLKIQYFGYQNKPIPVMNIYNNSFCVEKMGERDVENYILTENQFSELKNCLGNDFFAPSPSGLDSTINVVKPGLNWLKITYKAGLKTKIMVIPQDSLKLLGTFIYSMDLFSLKNDLNNMYNTIKRIELYVQLDYSSN